jgi:hypothetical protein
MKPINAIIKYGIIAVWLFDSSSMVCAQLSGPVAAPVDLLDIPAGIFRVQLEDLPANVRAGVLSRVAELKIPFEDFDSLRVHPRGGLYYVCDLEIPGILQSDKASPVFEGMQVFTDAVSVAYPPVWHSRPGSTNVLFLDFNGAVVSNTAWNSYPDFGLVSAWDCRPYSIDADETTFSVIEQQAMRTIWERVAEDYTPFDIDVTTEQPLTWNRHTGHVLITPDFDKNGVACPHEGAGGVAFIDVFGSEEYSYDYAGECYSPAWVFNYESPIALEYEAEAAAHEMGHNLALSHDGAKREAYYSGHENGSISWGPIMGTGYNRNVSQWSKGDYRFSNNPQDDLAIISTRLGYRLDDFGNDSLSAYPLALGPTGAVDQSGVVEQTYDADVFSFSAVSGIVDIAVSPYRDTSSTTWGGDLDVVLALYDELGGLIATNNPVLETTASLTTMVSNGVYYLHIHSTGVGDPLSPPTPSGYVRYGSIGQYVLTGSFPLDPDLDGDGLPNAWELEFFGGITNAVVTADDDGDGSDNWNEYVSGYNPTNALSYFSITNFNATATNGPSFIVSWKPVSGRVYGVDWSDQLTNTFINISGDLPYPAGSYTDTVERAGLQHFYRIDVRLNP